MIPPSVHLWFDYGAGLALIACALLTPLSGTVPGVALLTAGGLMIGAASITRWKGAALQAHISLDAHLNLDIGAGVLFVLAAATGYLGGGDGEWWALALVGLLILTLAVLTDRREAEPTGATFREVETIHTGDDLVTSAGAREVPSERPEADTESPSEWPDPVGRDDPEESRGGQAGS